MSRILLVHQPCDGGVGRHLCDLAGGLAERGHEVVLCGPALPRGLPASFALERCQLRRAVDPRHDAGAVAALARIVRRVRPQLLHAHSSKAGALARLARPAHPRLPVLYTPHGYAFAGHFERRLERIAYREIERALAPLASRVICVCEAEARLARSVGPATRVRVVHNGVEPAGEGPVDARMAELSKRGPVVCALTLLRPGKGLETLIDAAPRLLAAHPRAQLAIWGEGPDLKALRARAAAQGIADAVHFLGPTTQPLAVLRGAAIFVHPSWAESFPYAILEAMSVGAPIVASDVGGIPEALTAGESGLLVPAGEVDGLAGALLQLLDDPARAQRLGACARSRLEREFTRASMVAGVLGVYDEALS
ncbi:MAG TPA: glycosyltransferase [Solirubrobacteraceae bacterium]|nr:glycosyltransferase [Solirubrobacteraceae bacterium]